MLAITVALSDFERQVLTAVHQLGIRRGFRRVPFKAIAAESPFGTVHSVVNALLTLHDKGMLNQCDTITFCLTEAGESALLADDNVAVSGR